MRKKLIVTSSSSGNSKAKQQQQIIGSDSGNHTSSAESAKLLNRHPKLEDLAHHHNQLISVPTTTASSTTSSTSSSSSNSASLSLLTNPNKNLVQIKMPSSNKVTAITPTTPASYNNYKTDEFVADLVHTTKRGTRTRKRTHTHTLSHSHLQQVLLGFYNPQKKEKKILIKNFCSFFQNFLQDFRISIGIFLFCF
jgi:hypothetical protein